jgi:hypothetical protein
MKNKYANLLQWIVSLCLVFVFSGCLKDNLTRTYTIYTPVYMNKAEVLANINSSAPQPVKAAGKIYLYGTYLFMNEVNKGVHIFDNSQPSQPLKVGFISIPGNVDIAVKGTTLYTDLYTDLLAIDISNPRQARFKKLVPKVFPERYYGSNFIADSTRIITEWIKKDTTVKVSAAERFLGCRNCVFLQGGTMDVRSAAAAAAPVPGMGGSMARFAVVNDYLYAVNISQLNVLNISETLNPVKVSALPVGWNIETIYPFKEKLFIGSSAGMFIYDIKTPANPVREGQFSHARACDPVVADDNYAYVTLRSGSFCTGVNNQLDVININNIMAPSLVKTYPMTNPHGLAKDGSLLFLCDGKDGLKIYNTTYVSDLKLIKHIKGMETYDAIAWNKNLIVVATDGIYQYDYSDPVNLRFLSKITIQK